MGYLVILVCKHARDRNVVITLTLRKLPIWSHLLKKLLMENIFVQCLYVQEASYIID